MIAFPIGLVAPSLEAGIPVPSTKEELNNVNILQEKYLRFYIFCNAQLGQPMPSPTAHWENAKVIAKIPEKDLKKVSMHDLEQMGFQIGYSK